MGQFIATMSNFHWVPVCASLTVVFSHRLSSSRGGQSEASCLSPGGSFKLAAHSVAP